MNPAATALRLHAFKQLGARYRTIVGPIRLEYGRNLNPRPLDSGGAWHLSVGYPF